MYNNIVNCLIFYLILIVWLYWITIFAHIFSILYLILMLTSHDYSYHMYGNRNCTFLLHSAFMLCGNSLLFVVAFFLVLRMIIMFGLVGYVVFKYCFILISKGSYFLEVILCRVKYFREFFLYLELILY